ncbi:hypothetical protein KP509_32G059900 [Ceratopteris richardii]|nr:hypothetical protein KP509_32G059900 [Ceratopteris richardii]
MPYAGLNFGKVFSIDAQIQQFAQVKQQIVALIGANATERLLYRSIFYIVSGSNDWLNTYFFPGSPLPHLYTRTQYRDVLIDKLISQVKELYNLGVRNIALTGLPAFGCAPSQLRAYKSVNGTCIAWLNDLARDYNDHLRPRLLGLVDELPDSGFAFQNTYEALETVLRDPAAYGYTVVDTACCGIGKYGGFLNCFQGFPVCKDVQTHLFWDAYHSISRFNEQLVDMVWNNGPPYSYPYSGKDLINLLREKRL